MKKSIYILVVLLVLGFAITTVGLLVARHNKNSNTLPATPNTVNTPNTVAQQNPNPPPARRGRELQDPDAREALRLVGADAAAEMYWIQSINNRDLSGKERADLIEDLNEVGYQNLKQLTAVDLKLVQNRIKLIEELEAHAMDDVNAAAFKEAYKDLKNMLRSGKGD